MGVEITAQRSTLLRRSRPSRYQRDRHTLQRKRLSANSAWQTPGGNLGACRAAGHGVRRRAAWWSAGRD